MLKPFVDRHYSDIHHRKFGRAKIPKYSNYLGDDGLERILGNYLISNLYLWRVNQLQGHKFNCVLNINKLFKTMISWQQLRILLLAFTCGGVISVLFQIILAPPSEKSATELPTKTK